MAVSLGKRKQRDEADENGALQDEDDMRARFQRAFEAKFRPLGGSQKPKNKPEPVSEEQSDSESEESDWSGLSDEDGQIEVVDHGTMDSAEDEDREYEKKAFMSSKPPSSASSARLSKATTKAKFSPDDGDPTEATNLAHDLALQRLLKESHLLDSSAFSSSTSGGSAIAPTGKARLKALDLRMQDLGAKQSLSAQPKMPMAQRKGITGKATEREDKRRREAAENGVILERFRDVKGAAKRAEREKVRRRERGVGAPGVGRMRGGTLRLSRSDVREIEGSRRGSGRGKGGKDGRRGGR